MTNSHTTTVSASRRPWQGTTLGVLAVIGAVSTFLLAAILLMFPAMISLFLSGQAGIASGGMGVDLMANTQGMTEMLTAFMISFVFFLLAIGILDVFLARGFFKGQRWNIIVSLIFAALGALGIITDITNGVSQMGSLIFNIAIIAFYFYLLSFCWKDPFYAKK